MKKLLIIVMIVFGVAAYSRDFEYSEKEERGAGSVTLEKVGRYAFSKWFPEENATLDRTFYMELERSSRGSSGR